MQGIVICQINIGIFSCIKVSPAIHRMNLYLSEVSGCMIQAVSDQLVSANCNSIEVVSDE